MDKKLTERVPLLMAPSELRAIDDWMFANRLRSRGEAIRRLIERGLEPTNGATAEQAEPGEIPMPPKPPSGWPWSNVDRGATAQINVAVPARLKSKADFLVNQAKQSKSADRPAKLKDLVEELLQRYVDKALPGT